MGTTAVEVLDQELKRDQQGRKITPRDRRAELVAGYRGSGLTMAQFARREGINRYTLAKWVFLEARQGRAGTASVRFTEMKLPSALAGGWAFEVTLPNGWPVKVASAGALAELLSLINK